MDKYTYNNPEIIRYINKNYHAVKVDGEHKETIRVRGRDFAFVNKGRRGYNSLTAAVLQNKLSYPATAFMTQDFELLTPVYGYHSPEEFMPMLQFFGENVYKTQSWETYISNYKAKKK